MIKKTIILILLFFILGIFQFCEDCGGPIDFTYRTDGIKAGFQSDTNNIAKSKFIPLLDSAIIDAYGFIVQLEPKMIQVASTTDATFSIFGTAKACDPALNYYYQNQIVHIKLTSLEKYNNTIGINDTIPLNLLSLDGRELNSYVIEYQFEKLRVNNLRIKPAPELNKYHRFKVEIFTKEKLKYSTITPYVFLK